MAIPVYPAFFAVLAFHKTAGLFKKVKAEHDENYPRGTHAIFHIKRQGLLATRRAQLLWVLAAGVVFFLQAYVSKVYFDQCTVWMSGMTAQNASDEMQNPVLGKLYG